MDYMRDNFHIKYIDSKCKAGFLLPPGEGKGHLDAASPSIWGTFNDSDKSFGRIIEKWEPLPGAVSTVITPPCCWIILFEIKSPSPLKFVKNSSL